MKLFRLLEETSSHLKKKKEKRYCKPCDLFVPLIQKSLGVDY